MTDRTKRNGARWGAATWVAGVTAVLAALPVAASGRLPERLATHWGDGGSPDDSMPLWAAASFPALIWAVLALSVTFAGRRAGDASGAWVGASLLSGGVLLTGAQASIVRANLDRADWRDAGPVGMEVAITAAAAVAAAVLGWLAGRRAVPAAAPVRPAAGDVMEIPPGERRVWLSRTSNPWLHLTAALMGLPAAAAAVAAAAGLIGPRWELIVPFAIASLAVLACSSVRARVTEAGLEVSFGPLGRPARRWTPGDIVSARAETRTPAQVGGWGYRLGGRGTTVMLRAGECLVIHPRKGSEFAVSVDDAERGAALLNALCAQQRSST
ncbi:DUF1648 domain-containing protein [Streptomyces sp. NPDC127069]|uniref:DUF1648 domain-containing protein n=1 Tax=Streptomyces sp. NPDC127069 TaxID=3347128 RepID=UPI003665BB57